MVYGMKITRHFTQAGQSPYSNIPFHGVRSFVRQSSAAGAESAADDAPFIVPAQFSQASIESLVKFAFCKMPIPAKLKKAEENGIPQWLQSSVADDLALRLLSKEKQFTAETDARQIFNRLAGAWTYWGFKGGYFDSEQDALAFHDELCFMLATQRAAPDHAQWANTGLHWAYGLDIPAQKCFYADIQTGVVRHSFSAYEHPKTYSYCLQSAPDPSSETADFHPRDRLSELWRQESPFLNAEIAAGGNFSALPGIHEARQNTRKTLSLMPFLHIGDAVAEALAANESGGANSASARNIPAKMAVIDADHPDIEAYIDKQRLAAQKRLSLKTGRNITEKHIEALLRACAEFRSVADYNAAITEENGSAAVRRAEKRQDRFDEMAFCQNENTALKTAIQAAQRDAVADSVIQKALQFARQGFRKMPFAESSEIKTAITHDNSVENSSNVRQALSLPDVFLRAVEKNEDWSLLRRSDGNVEKRLKARVLWDKIAISSWDSSALSLHFQTSINDWHTVPAAGAIHCSDPNSEYFFLDNTVCPAAHINLFAFIRDENRFDGKAFSHAVRLWTLALEISLAMGQFPSEIIARTTQKYRPIALSYANFGALLTGMGIAYDSDRGRALCSALTALMTGTAYAASAELAAHIGAFKGYARNAQAMLRVISNHRRAVYGQIFGYEKLHTPPISLKTEECPCPEIAEQARAAWDSALQTGELHGFRHAHISLLSAAPAAEQIMDCETSNIMPQTSALKYRYTANGTIEAMPAPSVLQALRSLHYNAEQIADLSVYFLKYADAGNSFASVEDFLKKAPHLRAENYPLFSAVIKGSRTAEKGAERNAYSVESRIRMMAAAQAFLSGGSAQPFIMPGTSLVADCAKTYMFSWKLGLKAVALNCEYKNMPLITVENSDSTAESDYKFDESDIAEQAVHADIFAAEKNVKIREEAEHEGADSLPQHIVITEKRQRKILPARRAGYTQKTIIGGHKIYLRTGEFEDGCLGEIFIDMPKEGASFSAMMQNFAIAVSLGLQYGVPLEAYVNAFIQTKFAPEGLVHGSESIKHSSSVLDYIFRELAVSYLNRQDLTNTDISNFIQTSLAKPNTLKHGKPFSENKTPAAALQTDNPIQAVSESDGTFLSLLSSDSDNSAEFIDIKAAAANIDRDDSDFAELSNHEAAYSDTSPEYEYTEEETKILRDSVTFAFASEHISAASAPAQSTDSVAASNFTKSPHSLYENKGKKSKTSSDTIKPHSSYFGHAEMSDVKSLKSLMPFSDLDNQDVTAAYASPMKKPPQYSIKESAQQKAAETEQSATASISESHLERSLLHELFGDESANRILTTANESGKADISFERDAVLPPLPMEDEADETLLRNVRSAYSAYKNVYGRQMPEKTKQQTVLSEKLPHNNGNSSFSSSQERPIDKAKKQQTVLQKWTAVLCPQCHKFTSSSQASPLECVHCGFILPSENSENA